MEPTDETVPVETPAGLGLDTAERGPVLQDPERVGRYRIVDRLGAGGMGVVYRAFDPQLDREVALKLLRPGRAEGSTGSGGAMRLLREARALAMLSHPNVVPVYDVGIDDASGAVFLAMERVEGVALRRWFAAEPRPWQEVLEVMLQAGQGLVAAHAAGLVHRDFKPGNVLVGDDGRVRVLDFGLVAERGEGVSDSKPSGGISTDSGGRRLGDRMTQAGMVMGTVAYMAPEQLAGATPDASCDQFSFAVSVFEGIYGERPYPRRSTEGLRVVYRNGRFGETKAGGRLPRRLERALFRALSSAPEDRWPSVVALLDALDPQRGRRRLAAAGVVGVGVLTLALVPGRSSACEDGVHRTEQVWNPARAETLRTRFQATQVPFAADTWDRVAQRVDGTTARWAEAYVSACATQTGKGAERDATLACLRGALSDLDATLEVFAEADHEGVARAVAAVQRIDDRAACDDPGAIPTAPASAQAAVDAVREDLSRAKALVAAGRYEDAVRVADAAVQAARVVDYRPILAEAAFALGAARFRLSEMDEAESAWTESYWLAMADDDSRRAALAALSLVESSWERHDFDGADQWLRHADAAIERIGPDAGMQVSLLNSRGGIAAHRGQMQAASTDFEQALELADAELAADAPIVPDVLGNLATVYVQLGRFDDARALYDRMLAIRTERFGPGHPKIAESMRLIGTLYYYQLDPQTALQWQQRALELAQAALPPEHLDVAIGHADVASCLSDLSRFEEAQAHAEESLRIRRARLPPNHASFAESYADLGELASRRGNFGEARRHLVRALEIERASIGDRHVRIAYTLGNLGVVSMQLEEWERATSEFTEAREILIEQLGEDAPMLGICDNNMGMIEINRGNYAAAREHFARALAAYERRGESEHPVVASILTGLGRTAYQEKRLDESIELLERAVALGVAARLEPRLVAEAELALARSLWVGGGDRARALEIARRGYASMVELGGAETETAEQVAEDWAARGVRLGAVDRSG